LQLDQFKPEQILEQKLYSLLQAPQESSSEQYSSATDFLDALASGTATPGGGSAAAYAGAAAASLVSMVARLTIANKKYAQVIPEMQAILTQAEALRNELTLAIQLDASAFGNVMTAYKLPKESHEQQELRKKTIEQATLLATQAPIGVAHKSLRVLELIEQHIRQGNASALSDAATGAALTVSSILGAEYNVRINTKGLPTAKATPILNEFDTLKKRAAEIEARIHIALHERGL